MLASMCAVSASAESAPVPDNYHLVYDYGNNIQLYQSNEYSDMYYLHCLFTEDKELQTKQSSIVERFYEIETENDICVDESPNFFYPPEVLGSDILEVCGLVRKYDNETYPTIDFVNKTIIEQDLMTAIKEAPYGRSAEIYIKEQKDYDNILELINENNLSLDNITLYCGEEKMKEYEDYLSTLLDGTVYDPEIIVGDANSDKKIDSKDATSVLVNYADKILKSNSFYDVSNDYNMDGTVDAKDASLILIKAADDILNG